MKKIFLLLVLLVLSFNNAKAQEPTKLVDYEVQMKTVIGSTLIESFLLPEGTEFFIYKENGNSYLIANIPEESNYPEPHIRKKLVLNIVDFKINQ